MTLDDDLANGRLKARLARLLDDLAKLRPVEKTPEIRKQWKALEVQLDDVLRALRPKPTREEKLRHQEANLRQIEAVFGQIDRLLEAMPDFPELRRELTAKIAVWQARIRELERRRPV